MIIVGILISECIAQSISIIAQQRYLKLFNVNDRRIHSKSPALSFFSLIFITISIVLQLLQITLFNEKMDYITLTVTILIFLQGISVPYFFHFISTWLNIPLKNFPLISKFLIVKFCKIFKKNIYSYYRYENSNENSLLMNFLDIIRDYVQVKDKENKYTYINRSLCENFLNNKISNLIGKDSLEIAKEKRKSGKKFTFGEICIKSDEMTKNNRFPSTFFEYGYIDNKYVALQVLKAPVQKDEDIIGTIGIAKDVTSLVIQQDEIEKLFLKGELDDGINKFFSYNQQFKSLKNINMKI